MDAIEQSKILAWDARLDYLEYEEILGIDPEATVEDCRAAYHRFAQYFHPDMYPTADEPMREILCRIFQRGSEAYRVLTHSGLRARWSLAKSQGRRRLSDLAPPPELDLTQALSSLHESCRSAGAILESKLAAKALARGEISGATQHLHRALDYEGGASLEVVRCLEALASTSSP